MISAKLSRHVSSAVSHNMRIADVHRTGTRNAAQLWPGASNIAICRDRFEHRAKNQTSVFQSGTRLDLKHLAVTQNCENGQQLIRSTWFFSGTCINNQRVCIFKILFISRKIAIEAQTRSLRSDS